jgi:hypothetical protein
MGCGIGYRRAQVRPRAQRQPARASHWHKGTGEYPDGRTDDASGINLYTGELFPGRERGFLDYYSFAFKKRHMMELSFDQKKRLDFLRELDYSCA